MENITLDLDVIAVQDLDVIALQDLPESDGVATDDLGGIGLAGCCCTCGYTCDWTSWAE
jgi:hypothetical protein